LPQLVARPSIQTCNSQGFIPFLSGERVFNPCTIFMPIVHPRFHSFLTLRDGNSQPTHLQGRLQYVIGCSNSQYPCTRIGFIPALWAAFNPFTIEWPRFSFAGVRPSSIKQSFHSVPGQDFPSITAKFHSIRSIRSFISC
jgi:hypothetical protein